MVTSTPKILSRVGRNLVVRSVDHQFNPPTLKIVPHSNLFRISSRFKKFNSIGLGFSSLRDFDCRHFSSKMSEDLCPIVSKLESKFAKTRMHIKHRERTEELLRHVVEGGYEKLQVVADFDYTLTAMFDEDGERCVSSWGIIDNSPLMPPFYKGDTKALLDKYYPIEISPTMTAEEKIPHIVEWYTKVNELLSRCHLTRQNLDVMVQDCNCKLRVGTREWLAGLEAHRVPVLVLSAGMGDILVRVLDRFRINTPNVNTVSNFFKFNEQDCVSGFAGPMIHVFNKNESAVHSSSYFGDLASRNNVLLMGDSLGDIQMAKGVPSPANILKIGFLNEKIEDRLPLYEEAYDIVLLNDQTMELVTSLCQMIK